MGILGKRTLSGLSELGAELSASSASFDGSDGLRTGWEFYEEAAHGTFYEQTQTEVDKQISS